MKNGKKSLKENTKDHPEIIAANYATLSTTDRVRKIVSLATTPKVSFLANDNNFMYKSIIYALLTTVVKNSVFINYYL